MSHHLLKKGISLLISFAMVICLLPTAFAASETNPDMWQDGSGTVEIAFYTGTNASNLTSKYTITPSEGQTLVKAYDNGIGRLEAGLTTSDYFFQGNSMTVSGINNIPLGKYRVDLIYKTKTSGRAVVAFELDQKTLAQNINLSESDTSKAYTIPYESKLIHKTKNTNSFGNALYVQTINNEFIINSNESFEHTLKIISEKSGTLSLYGLLFTPIGPAIELSTGDTQLSLDEGNFLNVTATAPSSFDSFTWSSSNTNVATVSGESNEAVVTPVGIGTATITVTAVNSEDSSISASNSFKLTVVDIPGVTLNNTSAIIDLQEINKTVQISAETDEGFGNIAWESNDNEIATVTPGDNNTAVVTGISVGNAIITATVSNLSKPSIVKTASVNVKVISGGLVFEDGKLDSSTFELAQNINPEDIRFNNLEWSGLDLGDTVDVNPGKQAWVYEVNRVAPHSTLISYDTFEGSVKGAKDYDREQSSYFMSLTNENDLDPATSDWQFAITDNIPKEVNPTKADPYNSSQNIVDFYKTDYDASNWPGVAVPTSWNAQGIKNGTPYTGYFDSAYGYDPPYYTNGSSPKSFTINGVSRRIFPVQTYTNDASKENYYGNFACETPVDYNPVGFYRRTFDVPEEWIADKNKVFISVGGAEAVYYVYLNGYEVGYHEDSKTPGEFDLTPFLTADGKDNLLAIKVYRWADCSWLDDQDALRLAGIFREIYLMATPALHIQDYTVTTDFDDQYKDATLNVKAQINNYTNIDFENYNLVARVFDPDGKDILRGKNIDLSIGKVDANGTAEVSGSVLVDEPHKWFPDDPYLYTLVLTLYDNNTNTAIENISQQLGFREVSFPAPGSGIQDVIRINGQKIMMLGVNYQAFTPDRGHCATKEVTELDIKTIKQNNMNAIRTSHYPPDTYALYLADKYGLFMLLEANNECHGNTYNCISEDNMYLLAKSRVHNIVEQEKNRTSVVIWSLGNESGSQEGWKSITAEVRNWDPTRPVHYQHLGGSQTAQINTPDIYSSMYTSVANLISSNFKITGKAYSVFLCEFSHANGNGQGYLKDYVDAFRNEKRSIGGDIWDYDDQSIWTVPSDQSKMKWDYFGTGMYLGYGGDWGEGQNEGDGAMDGIISATREKQTEMAEVKKQFQMVNFLASDDDLKNQTVNVRNELYATDVNSFDFAWTLLENGEAIDSGIIEDLPSIPPANNGMDVFAKLPTKAVTIPYTLPENLRPGAEYFLNVQLLLKEDTDWADAGHVVAEEQFQLPVEDIPDNPAVVYDKNSTIEINEASDKITLTGKNFSMEFNKKDGYLYNYIYNNELLLSQGPKPEFSRKASRGEAGEVTKSIWNNIQSKLRTPTITVDEISQDNAVVVNVKYPTTINTNTIIIMTYVIDFNGAIGCTLDFRTDMEATIGTNELYRVGVDMVMPEGYEDIDWLARGPEDNYLNRKTGTNVGQYSTTVTDNYLFLSKPHHCGEHQDARWMALSGENKKSNLMFVSADKLLSVNALHFNVSDFDVSHTYEMTPRKETIVSVNGASRGRAAGLGILPDEYKLLTDNYHFSFTMVPYEPEADLQAVADPYRNIQYTNEDDYSQGTAEGKYDPDVKTVLVSEDFNGTVLSGWSKKANCFSVETSNPVDGTKYGHFVDGDNDGIQFNKTYNNDCDPMVIEFDFRVENNTSNKTLYIDRGGLSNPHLQLFFKANGELQVRQRTPEGANNNLSLGKFTTEAWHHLRWDIDLENSVFKITIDDGKPLEYMSFQQNEIDYIDRFRTRVQDGKYIDYDNVKIYTVDYNPTYDISSMIYSNNNTTPEAGASLKSVGIKRNKIKDIAVHLFVGVYNGNGVLVNAVSQPINADSFDSIGVATQIALEKALILPDEFDQSWQVKAYIWADDSLMPMADAYVSRSNFVFSSPSEYQIFQADENNEGQILVSGEIFTKGIKSVEARAITASDDDADWTKISSNETNFKGTLTVPAGSWYTIEVRGKLSNGTYVYSTIKNVGVGNDLSN